MIIKKVLFNVYCLFNGTYINQLNAMGHNNVDPDSYYSFLVAVKGLRGWHSLDMVFKALSKVYDHNKDDNCVLCFTS